MSTKRICVVSGVVMLAWFAVAPREWFPAGVLLWLVLLFKWKPGAGGSSRWLRRLRLKIALVFQFMRAKDYLVVFTLGDVEATGRYGYSARGLKSDLALEAFAKIYGFDEKPEIEVFEGVSVQQDGILEITPRRRRRLAATVFAASSARKILSSDWARSDPHDAAREVVQLLDKGIDDFWNDPHLAQQATLSIEEMRDDNEA